MKHIILILAMVLSSAVFSETTKKSSHKQTAAAATAPAKAAPAASKPFAREYGLAGCGLGSVVMGKNGTQVSAATTNGTSFNQTFAISAGTLNCLDPQAAEVANRMDQFIIVNHSQLQSDIAKGNGETISAISSYLGCSQSSKEIGESLKENYSTIFSKGNKANDITDHIINVILSHPGLSGKCQKIVG